MTDHSVSQWIDELKNGSEEAAQRIWERYFERLVRLAHRRLAGRVTRAVDEEDVALSALDSFCRNASAGRFPQLEDREDLWKLLFTITERKALTQLQHEARQKRGGGQVRGESVFERSDGDSQHGWSDAAVSREPTPELAAEVADQVRVLLDALQDDILVQIATLKMAGATNQEVADQVGCSIRSVKRKLQVIRTIWTQEDA